MYTCGVTVYDKCHLGHGRSLYIFEVIRRYLVFKGFGVKIVRNITDVDDKIIIKANQIREKQPELSIDKAVSEVTGSNIAAYYEDLNRLGLPKADVEPKATDHIAEMIALIQELVKKNAAYNREGNVYFRVKNFADYGRLSKRDTEEMQSGARVEVAEDKDDPLDFALWKKAKDNEPVWDSPWGKGRPGWHIECSAMARKYLGDTLDIHGGGKDLIFPHHENERAQSEALTGKTFSRYWIHHGLITVNKQKMAKSLGNFITLEDIVKKISSDTLKIFYLSATYHSPLDYSEKSIHEAVRVEERLRIIEHRLREYQKCSIDSINNAELKNMYDRIGQAMDDDFNMPQAFSVVFDLTEKIAEYKLNEEKSKDLFSQAKAVFEFFKDLFVLNLRDVVVHASTLELKSSVGSPRVIADLSEADILDLIEKRTMLRRQKKFKDADILRDDLLRKGIVLEDFPNGKTEWRRK